VLKYRQLCILSFALSFTLSWDLRRLAPYPCRPSTVILCRALSVLGYRYQQRCFCATVFIQINGVIEHYAPGSRPDQENAAPPARGTNVSKTMSRRLASSMMLFNTRRQLQDYGRINHQRCCGVVDFNIAVAAADAPRSNAPVRGLTTQVQFLKATTYLAPSSLIAVSSVLPYSTNQMIKMDDLMAVIVDEDDDGG
jgi:hypothetical protein